MGIMEIIEPAAINLQLALNMPCKSLTPTGRVYKVLFVRTILGQRNSPQEPMKVNIAKTAKVGEVKGNKILSHIVKMLHPSIKAASSSSLGSVRKAWRIKKIPKAFTANGRISPKYPAVIP